MKFTKLAGLTLLVLLVSLSGCSSMSKLLTKNSVDTVTQNTPQTTSLPESSDPWINKAQALKAQPNRYLSQSSNIELAPHLRQRFAQGQELMSQDKWAEAQDVYLRLAEQYPLMSGIWLQLATIQKNKITATMDEAAQQQKRDMQLSYLNNAVKANPDNYFAHNQLALVLRQQGQFTRALQHYDLALSSWPVFPEARLNRAILNDLYMGNKSKALEDYQLYQALLAEPSRQVKGWIMDIERQIQAQQQEFNANSGSIKGEGQ